MYFFPAVLLLLLYSMFWPALLKQQKSMLLLILGVVTLVVKWVLHLLSLSPSSSLLLALSSLSSHSLFTVTVSLICYLGFLSLFPSFSPLQAVNSQPFQCQCLQINLCVLSCVQCSPGGATNEKLPFAHCALIATAEAAAALPALSSN